MVDMHCHLLFGVDDGSKSLKSSIKALESLANLGYKDIILTPHYISDTKYISNKKSNIKVLNELIEELNNQNIEINLYLGNEIFITYDILNLLKKDEITSLNNSKYLLIELPMSGEFSGYIEVFLELINHDYKIILAHPERYIAFQKEYSKILELEEIGVYFQSNIESITGGYGRHAKKMMKKLLRDKKISFLATDIHYNKSSYDDYVKAYKKIQKYISVEEFDKLINTNPKNVILNKNI